MNNGENEEFSYSSSSLLQVSQVSDFVNEEFGSEQCDRVRMSRVSEKSELEFKGK